MTRIRSTTWDRAVAALIDTSLTNRTSGGLYRWEGRYLDRGDQLVLNEQIKLVNRRLQLPMSRLRPNLGLAATLDPCPRRCSASSAASPIIMLSSPLIGSMRPWPRLHATCATLTCRKWRHR